MRKNREMDSMDLSVNERRLLRVLGKMKRSGLPDLARELGTSEEAVLQYARLPADRGLVGIRKEVRKSYTLTEEGEE